MAIEQSNGIVALGRVEFVSVGAHPEFGKDAVGSWSIGLVGSTDTNPKTVKRINNRPVEILVAVRVRVPGVHRPTEVIRASQNIILRP